MSVYDFCNKKHAYYQDKAMVVIKKGLWIKYCWVIKKDSHSFSSNMIELEGIILSEINQKKK